MPPHPLSRPNKYWPFTLWLTFHRQPKGLIGNLTRFVETEETRPDWRDWQGLESSLQD